MDRFVVTKISATTNPQQTCWAAMHQDYAEHFVAYDTSQWPDETTAGKTCIKHLLASERGHYGPLEHAQIVFNVGWFPHSVMQQARTHRIGCSFDVQSGRYTGKRIEEAVEGIREIDEVFYLRPVGKYTDRQGKRYTYTSEMRNADKEFCTLAAYTYVAHIDQGYSEEHARGLIPFDFRQHFVVSFTLRALMHFLDLRSKRDAQLEIQKLCDLMMPHFHEWTPEIAEWYQVSRYGKARLAP